MGGEALAAAGFDVYAYDQLGAGRSTRLADVTGYTVARYAADLEAIRRVIGADKVIIVGQSWGGSLAARYLAAHPGNVAKVVFTSPGTIWPGATPDRDLSQLLTPAQRERHDELTESPRIPAEISRSSCWASTPRPRTPCSVIGRRTIASTSSLW